MTRRRATTDAATPPTETATVSTGMAAAAMALVRAWTRAYTWRMPPEWRARRRAEIASDLWECAAAFDRDFDHDDSDGPATSATEFVRHTHGVRLAIQIVGRLLRGLPHDLRWRVEQADRVEQRIAGAVALSAAAAAVAAAFFILPLMLPQALPKPAPAAWPFLAVPPPPPPPPPPPCRPPALGGCRP